MFEDAPADRVEVLHLAIAEIRKQLSKPREVLLLLLGLVVTRCSELEQDLFVCPRQTSA